MRHNDLMVIHESGSDYYDSEGQPRYRLTYRKTGEQSIQGEFEVPSAGKPEAFQSYLKWEARRK